MKVGYDIVGDVHGMGLTLRALLASLGYALAPGGGWRHPEGRELVFAGDILDRGPDPLGCLELVGELVAAGVAEMVLGNHETNALQYLDPDELRPRNAKNTRQLATTLAQVEDDPRRWERALEFLMPRPTRLELDGGRLRVIHACWDEEHIDDLPQIIGTREQLVRTARDPRVFAAVEACLKGPEEPSPKPYRDKDGILRSRRRIPWWTDYAPDAPVIAFGHYWFPWREEGREHTPSDPRMLGAGRNAACLDYSVGKGGRLVALRYPELEFVAISCRD